MARDLSLPGNVKSHNILMNIVKKTVDKWPTRVFAMKKQST
jgi:hypothetical protein